MHSDWFDSQCNMHGKCFTSLRSAAGAKFTGFMLGLSCRRTWISDCMGLWIIDVRFLNYLFWRQTLLTYGGQGCSQRCQVNDEGALSLKQACDMWITFSTSNASQLQQQILMPIVWATQPEQHEGAQSYNFAAAVHVNTQLWSTSDAEILSDGVLY